MGTDLQNQGFIFGNSQNQGKNCFTATYSYGVAVAHTALSTSFVRLTGKYNGANDYVWQDGTAGTTSSSYTTSNLQSSGGMYVGCTFNNTSYYWSSDRSELESERSLPGW